MYADGRGVRRSIARAVTLYRQAARQQQPSAEYNLGLCYLYGDGVPKRAAQARTWFRAAQRDGLVIDDPEIRAMLGAGVTRRTP
jgi:uncharacterized protein